MTSDNLDRFVASLLLRQRLVPPFNNKYVLAGRNDG